ncbi:MAG: DUF5659 domain-containing protein [Candidatus Gracilibacteria bacterium]|jgi:hypothetical protein|nr:DUF5659 domain-containing protein [Candidatus Gracilibacteria bacterium]
MKENFQTTDFSLAVTLLTLGYPIKKLDRDEDPRRVKFIFDQNDNIQKSIDEFWCDNLSVEPKKFCMQQKFLKSQLYHTV